MANIENLFIRNGTYYVRKRVPDGLIEKLGKRELKKSLRTKDEKVALRFFPDALLKIEAELDLCRDEQAPSSQSKPSLVISAYDIKRIYSDKFKAIQIAELDIRGRVFKYLQTR